MITIKIPGGLYCDALPTGEWVCMMVDAPYVQTSLGNVSTSTINGLNPLFVRMTMVGGFKFAGQSNNSPETLQWSQAGGWQRIQTVACGVSPVIYDRNGILEISRCQPGVGSQGYRYVDPDTGRLVTGDETYGSDFGLSEWSYLGNDWYIGQCNIEPGCAVRRGPEVRMVTQGTAARFIRGRLEAGKVSAGMVQDGGGPSLLIWMDESELSTLPLAGAGPVPPIPPEPPVPPIPPIPPVPPIPVSDEVLLMAGLTDAIYYFGTLPSGAAGKKRLAATRDKTAVFSVERNGSVNVQPASSDGRFEQFDVSDKVGTVNSANPGEADNFHAFPVIDVSGF